jgi:hypothetical protein
LGLLGNCRGLRSGNACNRAGRHRDLCARLLSISPHSDLAIKECGNEPIYVPSTTECTAAAVERRSREAASRLSEEKERPQLAPRKAFPGTGLFRTRWSADRFFGKCPQRRRDFAHSVLTTLGGYEKWKVNRPNHSGEIAACEKKNSNGCSVVSFQDVR